MIPIECMCSLDIFDDESYKEHKGDAIYWEIICLMGMGKSTLGHDGYVRSQAGTHPSSLMIDDRDLGCIWERMGKLGNTDQGVDPSSFRSMGTPRWLDDLRDTPTKSHDDRNKEEHTEKGVHPIMGHIDPRDEAIDGKMSSFECIWSTDRHDGSVE
jgi:hypothetical protein